MQRVFHPSAVILNDRQVSADDTANALSIAADSEQYWVLRKLWVSHDSVTGDFDAINSLITITVAFGGTTKWDSAVHPGGGGTGSVEFEAGPWEFDFGPGLYVGTVNQAMLITVGDFGANIASTVCCLYQ